MADDDYRGKAIYGKNSSSQSDRSEANFSSQSSQADQVAQDEMINLYSCSFEEFAKHMSKQYGEQ